jgi:hypothetical protein
MIQHLPNKGLLREEPRVVLVAFHPVWLPKRQTLVRTWRVAFPKQKREATKDVSAIPKLLVC